ncbi:nuclear factor of activated T-cells 5 isoform X3 [Culex quinquefasciatus]|uniref:nuclear factor of activated T-cells 5 isoform X3 n=1 Tax=Culex quinquefasciatus TaxID=7176 RepID=UPI0018E377DA|nr:nuclear factor of activated T-cells 5 isoform X3 [Culex quinquefasciatus]
MNRVRVGGRQPTTTTSSVEASDGEPSNGSRKLRSAGKNWLLQSAQWSKSYDSVINYWNTSRTTAAGSYETRSAAASPGSMGYSPPGGTVGPAGGQSADRFSGRLSASTTTLAAGQPAGGLNVKHGVSPSSSLASKLHRKVLRVPAKRIPGKVLHHHHHPGKLASVASKLTAAKQRLQQQQQAQQLQQFNLQQQQQQQRPVGSSTSSSSSSSANVNNCDNSNDSGLGFDRSLDSAAALGAAQFQNGTNPHHTSTGRPIQHSRVMTSSASRSLNRLPGKRPPMLSGSLGGGGGPVSGGGPFSNSGVVTLQSQLGCSSRDGKIQLQILTQPEQQHRARYQTEGSRGAVKDRSGNGFPVVRLVGHNKPAVLQVFIGTDVGRVAPHMFYQACKVSGKNSTPCVERKLEGTMVIEVDMKPDGDMTVTCDCVGILKERNVDVEHRFPDQSGPRAKKKSTRCRMVFRAAITHDDGSVETLQVCSQQIVCTQPPGVPEICKKSLVSCPAEGGLELFIVGKNFLKDTKVVFQRRKAPLGGAATAGGISVMPWEQTVIPDKEYLQQTHLICTVPPYISQDICEPVVVQIFIVSAGKRSETHNFTFTPKGHHTALSASTTTTGSFFGLGGGDEIGPSGPAASVGGGNTGPASFNSLNSSFSSNQSEDVSASSEAASAKKSLFLWGSQLANAAAVQETLDTGMMPPPVNVLPLSGGTTSRRPSLLVEQLSNMSSPPNFKAELLDESSRSPNNEDSLDRFPDSTDNSIDNSHILYRRRSVRQPSMDMMDESSSMSMLINENSAMDCGSGAGGPMMGFRSGLSTLMETNEVSNSATSPSACELKVMNLCIKQEQQMSATTRNQIEQMIATTSNLGNLNEINQIKAQLNVEGMLNAAVSPGGSLEKPPGMLEINSVVSLASNASHSPTSTVMMHNEMPGGATNTNHSPLSQDVMLNSQSTITVPSPGNLVLSSPGSSNEVSPHPHASISPDIILNPTISPTSMMCTPSNATVAATAAAAVAAAAAVSDGAAGLLSNQVFNNMAAVAANMIENQPQETTQAVQEIILNAAAEILTSQEPSVTTQSTINALISMNAQEMMTTSCQPQTQAIMSQQTLMSQCQPTAMMTAESMANALQQQQQQQQIVHNMLTESLHQQQQQATESLMLNLAAAAAAASQQQQQQQSVPEQMEIGNPIMSSTVTSTVPQQQQPPQQPMDTSPTQQQQQQQQQQIPTQMVVETAGGIQEQQQQQAVAAAAAAAVGANASIPQELTIMSDNDLISYINPNAFDAV